MWFSLLYPRKKLIGFYSHGFKYQLLFNWHWLAIAKRYYFGTILVVHTNASEWMVTFHQLYRSKFTFMRVILNLFLRILNLFLWINSKQMLINKNEWNSADLLWTNKSLTLDVAFWSITASAESELSKKNFLMVLFGSPYRQMLF